MCRIQSASSAEVDEDQEDGGETCGVCKESRGALLLIDIEEGQKDGSEEIKEEKKSLLK